ncbi:MAG: hypothetical protein KDD58_00250 [Bdellovibrionales bacterium]|nr:hypothetical protein [Bdellovibrionales bacterium]
MEVIINLDVFNERFRSGLVFSVIEGLANGCTAVFQSKNSLKETRKQIDLLTDIGVSQVKYYNKNDRWHLVVPKAVNGNQENCCGICGSNQ